MRFRTYSRMKDSGVDWLGVLPEHWTTQRLKYLVDIVAEKTEGPSEELPYVGLENIEPGTGKLLDSVGEQMPGGTANLFSPGDVLFGKLRPYLAKALRPDFRGRCTSELLVLRPRTVNRDYLFYLCLSDPFIKVVDSSTYGTRMPRANWEFIGNLPVPLPPYDEQVAIRDFLETYTQSIDNAVEKYRLLIDHLQEYRQTLITQAVTKGLDPNVPMKNSGIKWIGDVPEHWDITPLKHVVSCLDGRRVPLNAEQRSHMQGDIPYWGANGIVDYVNDWLFDEVLVLLGEDGAPFLDPLRDVAFTVEGKVWVNNHIHVLRPGNKVNHRFLMHALNAVDYYDYIDGSTRDKLTQSNMNRIRLPLPPKSEQDLIASFLDKKTQAIDTLIETKLLLVDRLQEYRQALITAAVTGKIDVRRDQRERTNIQDVC